MKNRYRCPENSGFWKYARKKLKVEKHIISAYKLMYKTCLISLKKKSIKRKSWKQIQINIYMTMAKRAIAVVEKVFRTRELEMEVYSRRVEL